MLIRQTAMEVSPIQITEFRGPAQDVTTAEQTKEVTPEEISQPVTMETTNLPVSTEPITMETTDATINSKEVDTTEPSRRALFHLEDETPSTSSSSEHTIEENLPSYEKGYDNPALDVTFDETQQKRAVVSFFIEDDLNNNSGQEKQLCNERTMAITELMSFMYGMILIIVGFAIPLSEALRGEWLSDTIPSVYNIFLYAGSSIFLVYIMVNIWMYQADPVTLNDSLDGSGDNNDNDLETKEDVKAKAKNKNLTLYISRSASAPRAISGDAISLNEDRRSRSDTFITSNDGPVPNGNMYDLPMRSAASFASLSHLNGQAQTIVPPGEIYDEVLQLNQTASLGHEGASFYFRLGALAFGIANFIFVVVQLDHYINNMNDCENPPEFYPLFFHLIFIMVQTFFIFKHTHVHVKKFKGIARFGFMHVLATNMCNWLRYLVFEVLEGIYDLNHTDEHDGVADSAYALNTSASQVQESAFGAAAEGNLTSCIHVQGLYMEIAPYLFPFVLEYSLIATATMAGMYHTLNIHITQDILDNIKRAIKKRRMSQEQLSTHMTQSHHGDLLAKSHRGMFAGALLLGGSVVSMVMFHFSIEESESMESSVRIFYCSDIAIHLLMLPSLFYCAQQLAHFKFTFNRDNSIDNNLLLVALAGLVLYYTFIVISSLSALVNNNVPDISNDVSALVAAAAFLNMIQGVLQGIFVVAGLQLCAANLKQQLQQPAKGNITFLIIANLTVWIFKSFQVKAVDQTSPVIFYGSTSWPIIKNTALPLVLFYRFHVSVCLADMWTSVYHQDTEPGYTVLS